MAKYKVLVTDRRHTSLVNEQSVLEPLDVELVDKFSSTEDELIENGKGAIGMLVSYAKVTRRVMEALPDLKIAVKYGVGYDNLDTQAGSELGVYTVNVPDYCIEEVALQSLALIMEGLRHAFYFAGEIKAGRWAKDPSVIKMHRPSVLTAGFVGIGRIAGRLVSYLKPLVNSIKYYDPFVNEVPGLERSPSLEALFASCDIISLHSPLTETTKGMVSSKVLNSARGCVLVNTSRGALVDRPSLIQALDSGKLGFYGADVGWEEPLAENSDNANLLARPNVLITPHLGWYSEESEIEVRKKAAMEIARVIRGEKPLHVV
jgi:D-3-phosphoglycerate dehydrogenase